MEGKVTDDMSQEQKTKVMEVEKPAEKFDKVEIQSIPAEGEGVGANSITEQHGRGNEESFQSSEESIHIGIATADVDVAEKRNVVSGEPETVSIVEEKVNRDDDVVEKEAVRNEVMEDKGVVQKVSDEVKDKEKVNLNVKEKTTAKESIHSPGFKAEEGGGRGTGCFGVRSYLHHFYDEKSPRVYDDFVEEDDFEFLVDPGKRRDRWCCWFRWCTWSGANLLLIGIITLLVGYLTPKRDVVVGFHDHLEILDRWAITFNQRLEFCRIAGLAIFCLGGFVVLVALVISACANNSERQRCERSYTYITTTIVEPYKDDCMVVRKIPITEEIKPIQPVGDVGPVAKDKAIVVQMPYY